MNDELSIEVVALRFAPVNRRGSKNGESWLNRGACAEPEPDPEPDPDPEGRAGAGER